MVLLNTQLHFIIKFLVMAGMRIPAFLLLKIILLVEFIYYIPNTNKYKRKTERARLPVFWTNLKVISIKFLIALHVQHITISIYLHINILHT